MTNTYVDTNVILRFLLKDNPAQLEQAKKWFKQAENGTIKLIVSPVVVAESCFVLESFYKVKRNEIADKFQVLLATRWLKVETRSALLGMWDYYKIGLHFVDSFLTTLAKEAGGKVLSFDKRLISKASKQII